jgi:hypothetical protein
MFTASFPSLVRSSLHQVRQLLESTEEVPIQVVDFFEACVVFLVAADQLRLADLSMHLEDISLAFLTHLFFKRETTSGYFTDRLAFSLLLLHERYRTVGKCAAAMNCISLLAASMPLLEEKCVS